jgi:FAD/FMN-containing dehydrogenase
MTVMDNHILHSFGQKLRGQLILPADAGYDAARQIWNAMIDRRPAMIVRCAGMADVMSAITFVRTHDLPVAVRGGGHNIAGSALCDDGMVIDLSGMRTVRIDPGAQRAHVDGGATLADFDHEAQAYGLATPLGINSTTGVAGLTLGGGFGWLSRKHGLAADNLVAADMVNADAQRLHVSATEHPDLFWAIRGGGGNFGVVTCFEFQLHPVGPDITSGLIVFPFEEAQTVLTRYRDFVDTMPEDLNVWVVMRKAPPLPFLAPDVHGKEILALAVFSTLPPAQTTDAVDTLRSFGRTYGEFVGTMPYIAWQKNFDPLLAPGARNYWKSHNFTHLSDDLITTVIDYLGRLPSPQCEIFIGCLGGEASRPAPDATAYPHREAKYAMNVHARWNDASEDDSCIAWARDFFAASAPYASSGVYVNFLTGDESESITQAYGGNLQRLARIKNSYDPHNLFRQNQNIKPAA